jgi:hypothetical protein
VLLKRVSLGHFVRDLNICGLSGRLGIELAHAVGLPALPALNRADLGRR